MVNALWKKWSGWLKVGVWVGLISFFFSWIKTIGLFQDISIQFSSIDVRSQLTGGLQVPEFVSKLSSFVLGDFSALGGGVLGSAISAVLAGVLLVVAGRLFYTYLLKYVWSAKTKGQKLVAVLLGGHIVLAMVLAWAFMLPSMLSIVASLIYFILIALVMSLFAKWKLVVVPND